MESKLNQNLKFKYKIIRKLILYFLLIILTFNFFLIKSTRAENKPYIMVNTAFTNDIFNMSFNTDGRYLITSDGFNLNIWDTKNGLSSTIKICASNKYNTAISYLDSKFVVVNCNDKTLIIDNSIQKVIKVIKESEHFSNYNGRYLVSREDEKGNSYINIWDTINEQIIKINKFGSSRSKPVFSLDGRFLTFIGEDLKSIKVFDSSTNTVYNLIDTNNGLSETLFPSRKAIVYSPNGGLLIANTQSYSNNIQIWNSTGELIQEFDPQINIVPIRPDPHQLRIITDLTFSPDSQFLAIALKNGLIRIWDINKAAFIKTMHEPANSHKLLTFHPDGQILASVSGNNTISLWDIWNEKLLITLISFKDQNWIAVTPDGLFDGSLSGWNTISWFFKGDSLDKIYEPEQFLNEFFYPGLLTEIMQGKLPNPPIAIAKKDRRLPEIKINSPLNGLKSTNRIIKVSINVKDVGSGVKDLRLYRNGVLVDRTKRGKLFISGILTFNVPLIAGKNIITTYAFNRDDIKSKDATVIVNGDSSLKRPATAYILAIGINQYQDNNLNLKFAGADASSVIDSFKQKFQHLNKYSKIVKTILQDKDATKQGIAKVIQNIANIAQPEDTLLIYYAGHGYAKGQHFYIIPHDFNSNNFDKTTISDTELSLLFEKLAPIQQMFIIDACQSGKLLEEGGKGPMNSAGLAQVAYEKGMYILAAAQSQEAALEIDKLGHGLVTYTLTEEGLAGKADYDPQDNKIFAKELLDYTANRVPKLQAEAMQQVRKLRNIELTFKPIRGIGGIIKKEDLGNSPLSEIENRTQTPRVFYRREAGEDLLLSIIK